MGLARKQPETGAVSLRAAREAAGASQGDLARLLGVSRSTVNRIERGKQKPHPKLAAMIEVWMERNER
jgi:DNA-binding XRE family transcriptional regulator